MNISEHYFRIELPSYVRGQVAIQGNWAFHNSAYIPWHGTTLLNLIHIMAWDHIIKSHLYYDLPLSKMPFVMAIQLALNDWCNLYERRNSGHTYTTISFHLLSYFNCTLCIYIDVSIILFHPRDYNINTDLHTLNTQSALMYKSCYILRDQSLENTRSWLALSINPANRCENRNW